LILFYPPHYDRESARPEKIPLTEFEIDEKFQCFYCPENYPALKSNLKKDMVNTHFSLEHCQQYRGKPTARLSSRRQCCFAFIPDAVVQILLYKETR